MWTLDLNKIFTAEMKAAQAQAVLLESFRVAIQAHVDTIARSRSYDSGTSLASYITSTNQAWAGLHRRISCYCLA